MSSSVDEYEAKYYILITSRYNTLKKSSQRNLIVWSGGKIQVFESNHKILDKCTAWN